MRWHYFFTFSNDKVRTFIYNTLPEMRQDHVKSDMYERLLRSTTRQWKYESLKRMKVSQRSIYPLTVRKFSVYIPDKFIVKADLRLREELCGQNNQKPKGGAGTWAYVH